jgi:hypothetical protein
MLIGRSSELKLEDGTYKPYAVFPELDSAIDFCAGSEIVSIFRSRNRTNKIILETDTTRVVYTRIPQKE